MEVIFNAAKWEEATSARDAPETKNYTKESVYKKIDKVDNLKAKRLRNVA